MTTSSHHLSRRGTVRLGLAGLALLVAVHGAAAAEDGLQQWFSSMFAGTAQPAPAPPRSRSDGADGARTRHPRSYASGPRRVWAKPLTVRLNRAKPQSTVAQVPTKPGKVAIYEDRTLRRGDVVMMSDGLRVFSGSKSWPHVAADFGGLDDGKRFGHDVTKAFAALDRVPRN